MSSLLSVSALVFLNVLSVAIIIYSVTRGFSVVLGSLKTIGGAPNTEGKSMEMEL